MRKQGHTHKLGHCITMTTSKNEEPVRDWLLTGQLRMAGQREDVYCVCVYCRRLKKVCIKKERKKKHMQIQFLALIFSYDNKSSTTKGINSIVNQFYCSPTLCPGSTWACCLSASVWLCVWEERGCGEEKQKSVCVCMRICIVDRLRDRGQAR